MANHKSAIKRARQNDKRRARNSGLRTKSKTSVKQALETILGAASRADAVKALVAGEKAMHKAVSKGVLPKARASRKTARLAAALNKKFKPEAKTAARK